MLSHKNWVLCILKEAGDGRIHKYSEDKVQWAVMPYKAFHRSYLYKLRGIQRFVRASKRSKITHERIDGNIKGVLGFSQGL